MDLRHHVDAVDQHALADRAAQSGVQCRAALGGVDLPSLEQCLDGLREVHLAGQLDQLGKAVGVDQVLRVVEENAGLAQRVALETLWIGGEGLAQVELLHAFALLAQGLPGGLLGGIQRLEIVFHRRARG